MCVPVKFAAKDLRVWVSYGSLHLIFKISLHWTAELDPVPEGWEWLQVAEVQLTLIEQLAIL